MFEIVRYYFRLEARMALFQGFITDIIDNSTKYLPVASVVGIIFIACDIFLCNKGCFFKPKHGRVKPRNLQVSRLRRVILIYLFFVYCFMIISIALISREPGSREGINLQVFRLFGNDLQQRMFSLENIVMFMPMGILLPLLYKRFDSVICCLSAGFIGSGMIELIQLVTHRGYCELDDILCNTAGALIGYLLLFAVRLIMRYAFRRISPKP
jgi:glycopeptide antibiotics resistance protein